MIKRYRGQKKNDYKLDKFNNKPENISRSLNTKPCWSEFVEQQLKNDKNALVNEKGQR